MRLTAILKEQVDFEVFRKFLREAPSKQRIESEMPKKTSH